MKTSLDVVLSKSAKQREKRLPPMWHPDPIEYVPLELLGYSLGQAALRSAEFPSRGTPAHFHTMACSGCESIREVVAAKVAELRVGLTPIDLLGLRLALTVYGGVPVTHQDRLGRIEAAVPLDDEFKALLAELRQRPLPQQR